MLDQANRAYKNLCYRLLAVSLVLGGCSVGPEFHRPDIKPSHADWAEQQIHGNEVQQPWWSALHDRQIDDLVHKVFANNPDMQASTERIIQSRRHIQAIGAGLWPQLNAQTGFEALQQSQNGPLPLKKIPFIPRYEQVRDAEFDASWDLDLFGARHRALQSAQANHALMVANADDLRKSLIAEMVRDVMNLRGLQAQLQSTEQGISLAEQMRLSVQHQVAAGDQPASALDDIQLVEQQWNAQRPPLRARIKAEAYAIALLCGQPPEWGLSLVHHAEPLPKLPPAPLGARTSILARRPDVRAAGERLAAATADIGEAKAQWFPQLSLGAAFGYQSVQGSHWLSSSSQTSNLFPILHWQIFSAGSIQAGVQFAESRQREETQNYIHTVLAALGDAEQHLASEHEAQQSWQNRQAATEAAIRSELHAQHAFQVGSINTQQHIQSEFQKIEAQLSEEQAHTQALTEWVALNKALAWPIQ